MACSIVGYNRYIIDIARPEFQLLVASLIDVPPVNSTVCIRDTSQKNMS